MGENYHEDKWHFDSNLRFQKDIFPSNENDLSDGEEGGESRIFIKYNQSLAVGMEISQVQWPYAGLLRGERAGYIPHCQNPKLSLERILLLQKTDLLVYERYLEDYQFPSSP